MKEVELLLILVTFLLHTTSGESTDDRRYNVLKFGQTENDYVVYQPEMGPFVTGFTVCSWIRKLRNVQMPTWFSYAVNGQAYEIQLTDMGARTYIFGDGSETGLRSLYTVSPGTWFHNCLGWDSASQTRNVYINGVLVDSKATPAGRTLKQGGYLMMGNEQDSGPGAGMDTNNIFGGEMYKLNVFSKKLSNAKIQEMATDRCSGVEETYGDVRSIRWEDILLETRNGDITEIGSGCAAIGKLRDKFQLTEDKLNDTLEELDRTTKELNSTVMELDSTTMKLNSTTMELDKTTKELNFIATIVHRDRTVMLVSWILAGVCFVTTVLISIFAGLKKCCCKTSIHAEPRYTDNTIKRCPPNPPTVAAPKPPDEAFYNDMEL